MINFQRIKTVEKYTFYMELANERADKRIKVFKSTLKKGLAPLEKSKTIEIQFLQMHASTVRGALQKMLHTFPAQHMFTQFYEDLLRLQIDLDRYYASLETIFASSEGITDLYKLTMRRVKHARDPKEINRHKSEYLGRLGKLMKKLTEPLEYLRHCRGIFRQLPVIQELPTIVIAGYPNVGKSTLLGALTGSTPKIASFPFTTQQLMLGYRDDIQVVDTPGLLDRLPEKRNDIEKHAAVALKHLADVMIFVYDSTESCGYSMEEQRNLYESIKKDTIVDIIEVYNKSDMESTAEGIHVSAKDNIGTEELWELLVARLSQYQNTAKQTDDK